VSYGDLDLATRELSVQDPGSVATLQDCSGHWQHPSSEDPPALVEDRASPNLDVVHHPARVAVVLIVHRVEQEADVDVPADVRREIGARTDLFNLTFLGFSDFVKELVTRSPQYLRSYGPHGFTLLHHAKVGKHVDLASWLQGRGLEEDLIEVFAS